MVVLHSGWGAELGQSGECGANAQADRIWSQGSAANGGGGIQLQSKNFEVGGYTVASAFAQRVCSLTPARIGIIAHEYLHGFKLPDLYDADVDEDPVAIGGVGYVSLFDSTDDDWPDDDHGDDLTRFSLELTASFLVLFYTATLISWLVRTAGL